MGRLGAKSDYESLRDARISENLARMEMLGLRHCAVELSEIASAAASSRAAAGSATQRKAPRQRVVSMTPLRRSSRLIAAAPTGSASTRRRSARLNGDSVQHKALPSSGSLSKLATAAAAMEDDEEEEKVVVVVDKKRVEALQERRCDSRGRGAVYDPVLGICCHFCRQKKLCGEEDCKRCGEGDLKQPCLGKTDCSSCHSSYGILCRACLKVRYGEEMEEVRKNKNWMCPHCIEEKGIKKFWICNSSICLKKRNIAPTGIAIYDAREQGYESVAHLLMDRLKRQAS
ncbi:hypothetical protein PR202_gb11200 [Eleusine coracana subsp. coracana]|uniref:Zinc-finger domain-containing protein n=1 Tax=Eleusine coracana subsp. coracana TaxID=191504 RepID=A0AAV5ELZ3_ELECO|nr:hypothetical protein QOZ80_3BG0264250 [Eleusine coracana subsp. coracana]GJN23541.1 hypothetical protein PR202_gb11200 [Eleusine coracana subsp. coracana]